MDFQYSKENATARARERLNNVVKNIVPPFAFALKSLVGLKILLPNGQLNNKATAITFPFVASTKDYQITRWPSRNYLAYFFWVSELIDKNIKNPTNNQENFVNKRKLICLGRINNGILSSLFIGGNVVRNFNSINSLNPNKTNNKQQLISA